MDNSKLNMDASILECEHELLALLTNIHKTFTNLTSKTCGPAEMAGLGQFDAYAICRECLDNVCDTDLHTMLKHMHNTYAGKTNIQYLHAEAKAVHGLMDMLEAFRSKFSILFLAYLDNEYDFTSIQSKLADKPATQDADANEDEKQEAGEDANADKLPSFCILLHTNSHVLTGICILASAYKHEASVLKLADICILALPP